MDLSRSGPVAISIPGVLKNRPVTFSCWVKLNSLKRFNIILSVAPKKSAAHWEIYTQPDGKLAVYMPAVGNFNSSVALGIGQWHWLAFRIEQNGFTLYADEKQVLARSVAKPLILDESPLIIGGITGDGNLHCAGTVDDLVISRGTDSLKGAVPNEPAQPNADTPAVFHFDTPDAPNAVGANSAIQVQGIHPAAGKTETVGFNTPAEREAMKQLLEKYYPKKVCERLLPFMHPTINAPVMDGLLLKTPAAVNQSPLARWGLLDVTQPPFSADPSGKTDSTRALQSAIDFARDHQMACWFPPGTYTVSDTLRCMKGYYIHQRQPSPSPFFEHLFPCVLMGSTVDPARRATIRLAPHSPGFDRDGKPKPVVEFFQLNSIRSITAANQNFPIQVNKANVSYNNLFANIDIDIGDGNPGAAGLQMRAAEGSSIQDVTIHANGGHCGLYQLPGSGGSCCNITVIGGRFGIDSGQNGKARMTQPVPTLTHVVLRNQREAAITCAPLDALILVGCRIESDVSGPVVKMADAVRSPGESPFSGELCMVDSVIERKAVDNGLPLIVSHRSVLLKNVYIRNARYAVNQEGSTNRTTNGWTQYRRLAVSLPPGPTTRQRYLGIPPNVTRDLQVPILENGVNEGGTAVDALAESPPENLCSQHIWSSDFPHWDSPGAVNVKKAPYFAKGDGITDDTAALQRAINENKIVFLPKGIYNISRTLKLRPDTHLIGLTMNLSWIYSRNPEGFFYSNTKARPLIETADTADADTVIAFLGFRINCARSKPADPAETKHYAVKWQCGGKSIWRFNCILPQSIVEYDPARSGTYQAVDITHPAVLITGHGSGRWYNFFFENFWPGHPLSSDVFMQGRQYELYKAPFLQIAHDEGNLRFYHLLIQHLWDDQGPYMDVDGADRVRIYGIKTECQKAHAFLGARNGRDIEVYGIGGTTGARPGGATVRFEDCGRVLVGAYAGHVSGLFCPLMDRTDSGINVKSDPLQRPLLYVRDGMHHEENNNGSNR